MAKILYGVSGEGSGHSSRAKLICQHLIEQGHSVKIVSYDRGYRNLKEHFDAIEIVGLSIASRDNKVSIIKTLSENLVKIPDGTRAFKKLKAVFKEFTPDCILTDFEPSTAYLASHYKLPLISIDNQHRMRYMAYDYPSKLKKDAVITETLIKAMIPKPWYSLITSFHFGELKNGRCAVFPPILRPSVLKHDATTKDHLLVYITSGFESLLELLPLFPKENFLVYGAPESFSSSTKTDTEQSHIYYKTFSEDGFLTDLSSAKGVIATAGFTLISESLYYKKPYLAFPMNGQFEQQLNAYMLDKLGLGKNGGFPPNKTSISAFLYELDEYHEALKDYTAFGNQALTNKLDELLADEMKLLNSYKP